MHIGAATGHAIGSPLLFGLLGPLFAHLAGIGDERAVDLDTIAVVQRLAPFHRAAVDAELVDRQVNLGVLLHDAGLLDGRLHAGLGRHPQGNHRLLLRQGIDNLDIELVRHRIPPSPGWRRRRPWSSPGRGTPDQMPPR